MTKINLTKTDFKEYLLCNKCLWLKKKKPDEYIDGEFSQFLKKLIKDGYEVERYAQGLFPGGVFVSGDKETLIKKTKELLKGTKPIFQATFETIEGLFAKIDILNFNEETKKWDLYEVKASSDIKTDIQHNHVKDLIFQTILLENAGVDLGESYIIHLNKEYRRNGEVDIHELLTTENLKEEVGEQKEEVRDEMNQALKLLAKDEIALDSCDCLYKSSGQHCDCFAKFNPQVPEYSVHNILMGKKLKALVDDGIVDITKIPENFELTDIQQQKVDLQKDEQPIINREAVDEALSGLVYPIYFFDYETYPSPIPPLDAYKPNQHFVFQVSIHALHEDGELEHFEFLAEEMEGSTEALVNMMRDSIGDTGSIVVWNDVFEKGRNIELAELHPEEKDFLLGLNERTFDLMKVFKRDYTRPDFYGSASIKAVLPAMVPELSYKDLEVQNGTMAMSEWKKIIDGELGLKSAQKARKDLLDYCGLDTFAMVEIYKKIKEES